MSDDRAVTVGVDVGTTAVKAIAVDGDGQVVARARAPHRVISDAPDHLAHDADQAWRRGPRQAFAAVTAEAEAAGRPVAGVCVSAMVPSLAAVDRRGRALTPGLLYGDGRGHPEGPPGDDEHGPGAMRDAEGFLRWARAEAPDAAGYWPAQAAASHALSGVPAVDTAMTASLGALHSWGKWDEGVLGDLGVDVAQMPQVFPMAEAAAVIPGGDTVIAGGTVDALCDQIVSGATQVGDVLAICGATLVVWIVTDTWLEVDGLWTVPHTVPDRVLIGGASNSGAIFVDWARTLVGRPPPARHRPGADAGADDDGRSGAPDRPPVWLPYVRGERSPFHDPTLRASLHGLDITHGPDDVVRAAYEASGFVIRTLIDRSGVEARRVVASGGGTRATAWMAAIADATGLPVDTVAVPEGAAYGAAYLARMAAGLAGSLDGADRWARVGRRIEPDPAWRAAATDRYRRYRELGPGS